ncbi:MAG: OmpA family protein, partial [Bacteroidia bacterium]|nr:OmpA family protein [Bacteroidia bacterium]
TRTFQRMVTPATVQEREVPAEFTTRTFKKVSSNATSTANEIAAVYVNRNFQKLASDATFENVETPAEYTTRTFQKLAYDATFDVVTGGTSMVLENIFFETGSSVLKQSSYTEIERLAEMLKSKSDLEVALVGHTDSQGSESSNQVLSQNRAKAVYDALVDRGIDASRMRYEGQGESSPRATNATADGRRQNRRTELLTYGDTGESMTIHAYQALATDATTESIARPAQTATRTFQTLATDATTEAIDSPAEYTTRTFQKLAADANFEQMDNPAEYTTRTFQKLAADANTQTVEIPAQYKTVTKRQLVKAGGFTEWREVVCDADITSELVRSVQSALIERGYNVGSAGADNVMGAATKSALVKFQKDNGLPVGQLDFETLRALGIK